MSSVPWAYGRGAPAPSRAAYSGLALSSTIGVPAWKDCRNAPYPELVAALPNPAEPPVRGSPAVTVAGVPAGAVTAEVIT